MKKQMELKEEKVMVLQIEGDSSAGGEGGESETDGGGVSTGALSGGFPRGGGGELEDGDFGTFFGGGGTGGWRFWDILWRRRRIAVRGEADLPQRWGEAGGGNASGGGEAGGGNAGGGDEVGGGVAGGGERNGEGGGVAVSEGDEGAGVLEV
ncbi:glycine-rich cell wall structural protein-like [Neltuma alba]|uniref:glycine-rich cell wall structural protein-like n=1 Tax=Neltuma alba TaxID=207710 RepID=UPI0010A378A3|nr:glycine-rich cell wall structural protein-like [Prosopis alba]